MAPIENIEDLVTAIQERIDEYETGTPEQRAERPLIANEYGVLRNAVREWFAEIQQGKAPAYREFAENVVVRGDCIVTFNYDVSLERELRRSGKFEVGDGYGFSIEGLPGGSATTILKLHGSTSWLALLFGGARGPAAFQPGSTLGTRPVIGKNELSFLGYADAVDPVFGNGGAAMPVMIFPTRSKNFYFAGSTGVEYSEFWNRLWLQAEAALRSSDHVVLCGYSPVSVDERARRLLLNAPRKKARIVVASGNDTERIVGEYRRSGYARTVAAEDALFEDWVARSAVSLTGFR